MSVTVVLDEEPAEQLQQQADAVQVSVGDFAVRILQDAAQWPSDSKAWKKINARRLDLIALEYAHDLTAEEAQELDALQNVVAKASEPEDRKLLKTLRDFEQRASSPLGTVHE